MILLSGYDILDLTFRHIFEAFAVLIVLWEIFKKLKEIKKTSDDEHAKRELWDKAANTIKEKEEVWDNTVADIKGEREFMMRRYDSRLDELELQIKENHVTSEAKMQEIRTDVMILAEAIRAVLEGQIEQGCDGPVKAAKEKLDHYLIESLGR